MSGTREPGSYHAQALVRGVDILRQLGRYGEPMGLTDLQAATGLPKSTLVRLLSVLEDEQLVFRFDETPRYVLGSTLIELAEPVRQGLDATLLARPYLRRLAHQSGQTANLGVLDGISVLHVCVEEPDRPIRFRSQTASRDHAYCTGLGKALLANLPKEQLGAHLPAEPYERFGPNTPTNRDHLVGELRRIQETDVAFDDEERDFGVRCIAVRIPWDDVGAAISITGPTGEMVEEVRVRLGRWLSDTAEEMRQNVALRESLRIVTDAMS